MNAKKAFFSKIKKGIFFKIKRDIFFQINAEKREFCPDDKGFISR